MKDFGRNIRIDGTSYGANRASGGTYISSGNVPGLIGVAPPGSAAPQDTAQQRRETAETEARHYEDQVATELKSIRNTEAGRALLAEVGRQRRMLTITAYLPQDRDWTNGKTISNAKDSTRKRWLVRHCQGEDQCEPVLDKDGERKRGTGVGSDVEIEFITPSLARTIWSKPAVAVKHKWIEGEERHTLAFADEILVHELVHALRDMAGLSVCRRVPRQVHYGTIEEFFAIVVANVYRSECGRSGVRNSNHGKWETMHCSGKHFLQLHFNRRHLRQLRRQHPLLVADLWRIEVYFNPFREMLLAPPY